jgi:hypothetical protein
MSRVTPPAAVERVTEQPAACASMKGWVASQLDP